MAKFHGQKYNVDDPWSSSPRVGQGPEINDLLSPISRIYVDGFTAGSGISSTVLDVWTEVTSFRAPVDGCEQIHLKDTQILSEWEMQILACV